MNLSFNYNFIFNLNRSPISPLLNLLCLSACSHRLRVKGCVFLAQPLFNIIDVVGDKGHEEKDEPAVEDQNVEKLRIPRQYVTTQLGYHRQRLLVA